MSLSKQDMMVVLQNDVGELDTYLDAPDYQNAVDDAERETGFAFPNSDDTQLYWLKERAKRHLFFILMAGSAHKFKVKQYSLHQRFEHYRDIIRDMDKRWETYLETAEELFTGDETFKAFGTKIDAGFQYESDTGRDTTYSDDNVVLHHPNESS